ncbi:MAG TPA: competence/damage-inducible protein A [Candidatus Binatia bacterium]
MTMTAGIIIIGNEVLSGKTQDLNSHFLCKELRTLGVDVRRVSVIPDDVSLIGREAAAFSRQWDVVFTTGGVGPTHDDVTMEGIARGFEVKIIRHPDLEGRLRQRHGNQINSARLRMAEVPEGAELISDPQLYAPVIKFRNLYILPGIPKILQQQFHAIKDRFRESPFLLKIIYVKEGEGTLAAKLNDLLGRFPDLALGSYPVLDNPDFRVKVTLESKDAGYLAKAFTALLSTLPPESVHGIEEH